MNKHGNGKCLGQGHRSMTKTEVGQLLIQGLPELTCKREIPSFLIIKTVVKKEKKSCQSSDPTL
jgi:hypothetical protein